MKLKNVFSNEFMEMYKSGVRVFNKINLQYADISQASLKDVVIKDSRLFFVTFRDCSLTDVNFINCEIIYNTFYGGKLENLIFDKCSINFGFLNNLTLKNVKMSRCKITWTAIFGSAIGELDFSTSDRFKFFTDPSQITQRDVEEGIISLGPVLDSLHMSIKNRIKEELRTDAGSYGIKLPESSELKSKYNNQQTTSIKDYVKQISDISNIVINAYHAANPYKRKSSYHKPYVTSN